MTPGGAAKAAAGELLKHAAGGEGAATIRFPGEVADATGNANDIMDVINQAKADAAAAPNLPIDQVVENSLTDFFRQVDAYTGAIHTVGSDGFDLTVGQLSRGMLDDLQRQRNNLNKPLPGAPWPNDMPPGGPGPNNSPYPNIPGRAPGSGPTDRPYDPTAPDPAGPGGPGGFPPLHLPHFMDPLVIDLGGDGVPFLSMAQSQVSFDIDNDGFAEHVTWITPNDAFLVRDVNQNGVIDNSTELFGTAQLTGHAALAAYDSNQDGVIDGQDPIFAELRLWRDLNSDGVSQPGELFTLPDLGISAISLTATTINVQSADGILVSRSNVANSAGTASAYSVNLVVDQVYTHEVLPSDFTYDPEVVLLPTLRGFGTVSDLQVAMTRDPSLKSDVKSFVHDLAGMTYEQAVDAARNLLFKWVGVEQVDPGSRGAGYDAREIAVVEALTGTTYPQQLLPSWGFGPSLEAYFQTFFRGYLSRLVEQAWSSDLLLQEVSDPFAIVEERVVYNPTKLLSGGDLTDGQNLYQDLTINIGALGQHLLDGSQFATGTELQSLIIPLLRDMLTDKYGSLTDAASDIVNDVNLALLSNTPGLAAGLEAVFGMPLLSGTSDGDTVAASAPSVILGAAGDDTVQGSSGTDFVFAGDGNDIVVGGSANDLLVGEAGADSLSGEGGDDHLIGGAGDDLLEGGSGNDLLSGGDGNDVILGGDGNDALQGQGGDDALQGGAGNDLYAFSDGSGSDTISDTSGFDTLLIQGSLSAADAHYSFANGGQQDLLISFAGSADTITILGYFDSNGAPTVEKLVFADGTIVDARAIRDAAYAGLATDGSDNIHGFAVGTTVIGLGGDDILVGGPSGDRLVGGVGNDVLTGSGGDDTYEFAPGDGQDVVRDYGSPYDGWRGNDTVALHETLPADVTVTEIEGGSSLLLTFAGRSDSIKLENDVNNEDFRIERVVFDDGTIWTHADLMAKALAATSGDQILFGSYDGETLSGGGGNDVIDARGGNDILVGGNGDDTLSGSGGDDVYRFERGDGNDTVREFTNSFSGWGGNDAIELGAGINPGDVTVSEGNGGRDIILTINNGGGSITLAETMVNIDDRVEQVRFADGTVWTSADLVALATTGTAGPDSIWGSFDGDTLSGGAGNDTIDGRGGNDVLVGGAGDDILSGSGGDDVYRFARGDGNDIVRDFVSADSGWGGNDAIEFSAGITAANVTVSQAANGRDLILTVNNGGGSITIADALVNGDDRIEAVRFADGTSWSSESLVARSMGATDGADAIAGDNGPNTISGLGGNDVIDGHWGNDVLIGGAGDDLLHGSGGDDTYVFNRGDGNDIVQDLIDWNSGWGGYDTLAFGADVAPSDVTVAEVNNGRDLVLTLNNGGGSVLISGTMVDGNYRIEQVTFAGGTVWTHADLVAKATAGTAGADVIQGSYDGETLSGAGGNDAIDGRWGNDILIGGTGDDVLYGSGGDDTYVFARGDGNDRVQDLVDWNSGGGGFDEIAFTDGIAPSDVTVTEINNGNDLLLTVNNGGGSVTISGTMTDGNQRIEQVTFADGTVWAHADLVARATAGTAGADVIQGSYDGETLSGGAGNDVIDGRWGNDVLIGGTGDDVLFGSGGDDTYVFGRGDGNDNVQDFVSTSSGWGGYDTIQFLAGIAPSDVTVTEIDNGGDLLLTVNNGGGSVRLNDTMINGDQRIERVVFADGTVWLHADLVAKATGGTPGNDVIQGSYDGEALSGGAGNDVIDGRWGDDTLSGGAGNDVLYGSGGNDTYLFGIGDGSDVIRDFIDANSGWGGYDRLLLGPGITPADITVGPADNWGSYILYVGDGTDNVELQGAATWGGDYAIEEVRFADGTVWGPADLAARVTLGWNGDDVLTGTSGNDSLRGLGGNDIIDGSAGNDTIKGDGGADQLKGSDGDDTLTGGAGNDSLDGGAGDDIAVFAGARSDYAISIAGNVVTVQDLNPSVDGDDGTDQLIGIEHLQFKDGIVAAPTAATGLTGLSFLAPQNSAITTMGVAAALGGGVYRMTPSQNSQVGAVWGTVDLSHNVVWTGKLNFGTNDGGDGIGFALANLSELTSQALGSYGVQIGSTFGIRFATWSNLGAGNPNSDFGQFLLNGNLYDTGFGGYQVVNELENGAWHNVQLSWDAATMTLTYTLDGQFTQSKTYDVSTNLLGGGTVAAFGFGASTGGLNNLQQVEIDSVMVSTNSPAVDENSPPGTLVAKLVGIETNPGETLTYAIVDGNGQVVSDPLFEITNGNELHVKAGATLDHETAATHALNIRITDAEGSITVPVTVSVRDLAETHNGTAGADAFQFGQGYEGNGATADHIIGFQSGTDTIDLSGMDSNIGLAGDQAFTFIGANAFSGTAGELHYIWNGTDTVLEGDVDGNGVADFQIVLAGQVTPVSTDFLL